MPSITSLGVGTNGLDLESLVSKLVANEQVPVTQLNTRTEKLKTQLSAFGRVQSAVAAMRDAASKLTSPSTWGATTATSSDASSVAVTAGTGATAGNVSVQVTKLAASQSIASGVITGGSTGVLGQGSITIELGSWDTGQTTFTPKSGATAVTIPVGASEEQLAQVRDKINAANAGVVASIVTDSSGSRLVMRSVATGEANGFRVTVSDSDGNDADNAGLSRLAFDPSNSVTQMTQKVSASNAVALINGLEINSETNTLSEAIDGLNITLLKATGVNEINLTVAPDKEGLKKAITDFATAYNAIASLLRDQTKYDAANKVAGTLQGDAAAVGLQYQMRSIAASSTTLAGTIGRLADIGLDPGTDGTLKINDAKLTAALATPDKLKLLFMGVDPNDEENNGLAQKLRSFADKVLGAEGTLTSRQAGLQTSISNNGKRADDLQAHVDMVEKRLRARYTALDTQMSQLNALSAYVSQQMALMNSSK
jgi:flagellar hook-associated protein 2